MKGLQQSSVYAWGIPAEWIVPFVALPMWHVTRDLIVLLPLVMLLASLAALLPLLHVSSSLGSTVVASATLRCVQGFQGYLWKCYIMMAALRCRVESCSVPCACVFNPFCMSAMEAGVAVARAQRTCCTGIASVPCTESVLTHAQLGWVSLPDFAHLSVIGTAQVVLLTWCVVCKAHHRSSSALGCTNRLGQQQLCCMYVLQHMYRLSFFLPYCSLLS